MTLALIAYSYSAGRLIAPILAFGLVIFATNRQALWSVLKTWVVFAITMSPFLVAYLNNSRGLTQRFRGVTNLSSNLSLTENLGMVASALYADVSLKFFLFDGDPIIREHIEGIGQFLVATFALGVFGIIIVVVRRRINAWWKLILFGSFVSLIPGAITTGRYHSVRDLAFPIFFMILTVPAISWLLGRSWAGVTDCGAPSGAFVMSARERYLRQGLLISLLVLTAIQAVNFQTLFRSFHGHAVRRHIFYADFPKFFDLAVEYPDRPIYVEEVGDPIFILTEWYATVKGIDLSEFVHLRLNQLPPDGALVLSSRRKGAPNGSEAINSDPYYVLYRYRSPNGP